MRIILDTGVLFYPVDLLQLANRKEDVVLPVVAYAERLRQLREQRRNEDEFDEWLRRSAITVEPFDREQAKRFAASLSTEAWRRLARDAFIAGHLEAGDVLWTTNSKDFLRLGVLPGQLVQVPQTRQS